MISGSSVQHKQTWWKGYRLSHCVSEFLNLTATLCLRFVFFGTNSNARHFIVYISCVWWHKIVNPSTWIRNYIQYKVWGETAKLLRWNLICVDKRIPFIGDRPYSEPMFAHSRTTLVAFQFVRDKTKRGWINIAISFWFWWQDEMEINVTCLPVSLQWRHNGRDGVSNHQHHDCLLNRFRRRSMKTSKLRVTGLCAGNSPGTGEFPAKMANNAENVSI